MFACSTLLDNAPNYIVGCVIQRRTHYFNLFFFLFLAHGSILLTRQILDVLTSAISQHILVWFYTKQRDCLYMDSNLLCQNVHYCQKYDITIFYIQMGFFQIYGKLLRRFNSNMNARKTNDNHSTTHFTRNSTLSHTILYLVLCSLFLKRTLLLFHLKIEKNVENVQEKCPQTHFCVYIILESMLRWSKKKS